MPWDNSDRRDRLPSGWPRLVAFVKKRANGRCEKRLESGKRCPREGTDCDHIVPGDNHDPSNLQWLCATHHGQKSSREGLAARTKSKAARLRPREQHPGARRGA